MFRIRFFTPAVLDENGWPHAGGELVLGDARLIFLADLSYWDIRHYQNQWRGAISRLLQGGSSTALISAYGGPRGSTHKMWALWRLDDHVYVQEHVVLAAELEAPFDPNEPYVHIGERVPATENALPIPEWRIEFEHLHAALLGLRGPTRFG
jgi:CdiI N-terminal domain